MTISVGSRRGSGVVYRTNCDNGSWFSAVLTARHIFYDRVWVPAPPDPDEEIVEPDMEGVSEIFFPGMGPGEWVIQKIDTSDLKVTVYDHENEREFTYPAILVDDSEDLDVAVLHFGGPAIGVAELGERLPREGEDSIAIGRSIEEDDVAAPGVPAPTEGIISVARMDRKHIVSSAPIYFGYSGGGLFVKEDGRWKLAGIQVQIRASGGDWVWHYALATRISLVKDWMQSQGLSQ